jgi:glutathione S-transferase
MVSRLMLAGRTWVAGDRFTLADILLFVGGEIEVGETGLAGELGVEDDAVELALEDL